jgi:hypothetical protein
LLWIEPEDYDFDEDGKTPEFVTLMEWFMESEWTTYFTEDTLRLYGTLVYYVGMEKWTMAADLVDGYLREKGWYLITHI